MPGHRHEILPLSRTFQSGSRILRPARPRAKAENLACVTSRFSEVQISEPTIEQSSTTETTWLGLASCDRKAAVAEQVYEILEHAYRGLGGINKGSGFKNPTDMLESIPVWRIVFSERKIVSVTMFKENAGYLKMVAYAATRDASEDIKQTDITDFLRASHAELSGPILTKVLRLIKSQKDYLLDRTKVMPERRTLTVDEYGAEKLLDGENEVTFHKLQSEFPALLKHAYIREIGSTFKLKLLLGTWCQLPDSFLQTPSSSCLPL